MIVMGADQKFDWAASIASTIDWWREAGMDVAIAEEPRNWLKPVAEAPAFSDAPAAKPTPVSVAASTAPASAAPIRVNVAMPSEIAAFEAWRLSDAAPDSAWGSTRIGATGSPQSPLMVVLEMPERDDMATGTLLSGAVGILFDRMLSAIGRDRASVYLVPMCVVRPSTGSIAPDVLPALSAALRHQVSLAGPTRVLLFGNAVSRALLGADIAEMRGALRPVNRKERKQVTPIEAVASFHPRFLLERPAAKAEAWKDLLLLAQGIDA
ncbi:uracil-DNA glycosylase family protein [Sphingomonas sp. 28-62-11]|uniref:uracil-DNA glycosylase family protein n=1 Tax=Sphingomonas sp. 28-62-11 TaxID=1970432 RepID=UPI0035A992DA